MKLMVCVPSQDTWNGLTAKCIADAMAQFEATKFSLEGEEIKKEIALTNITGSHLPDQRHRCVFAALEADATHMVFVDSDVTFPQDAFVRLIRHSLPVVAANFPRHEIPTKTTAYVDTTDNIITEPEGNITIQDEYIGPLFSPPDATGLVEVQSVGTGLMMIQMTVFDHIETPFFQFEPQPPNGLRQIGEDVYFCRKVRAKGIPVFVDQDLSKNCGHMGTIEFTHGFVSKSTDVFEHMYREKRKEYEADAQRQRKVKSNRGAPMPNCPGCGVPEGAYHKANCEQVPIGDAQWTSAAE